VTETPAPAPDPELPFTDVGDPYFPLLRVAAEDDRITFVPAVAPGEYDLRTLAGGRWVLVPRPPAKLPYRVVDRFGRGWLTCYERASTYPDVEGVWTLDRIIAERGPVREVVGPTREDVDELEHALACAKRRAAATVLYALHRVAQGIREKYGDDDLLVAGRPGSWESALLPRLAHEVGARISASRVDAAATAVTIATLELWTTGRETYTEVAENLASVFGRVVDGRGGWDQVADQWLLESPYDEEVRNLLTSTSRYFGPYNG
jgi:hypothetical protein